MSSGATSLERAIRDEIGEAAAPTIFGGHASADQLDLLRAPDGRLPSNIFQMVRQGEPEKRGPGRRPGSLNKRSRDLAKMLDHSGPDPVLWMQQLFAMPLDQLVEMLLIADGTIERRRQLDANLEDLSKHVRGMAETLRKGGADNGSNTASSIDRLADACEALEAVASTSQGKPGDVAIKALNVQLAASKAVGEYRHSKKPVEAVIKHTHDAVLVLPGAPAEGGFAALDANVRQASEIIGIALAQGEITAESLVGLRLRDGLLVDAEFEDVDDGEPGE